MTKINSLTAKVFSSSSTTTVKIISYIIVEALAVLATYCTYTRPSAIVFWLGIALSVFLYAVTGAFRGLIKGAGFFGKLYGLFMSLITLICSLFIYIPLIGVIIAFFGKYIFLVVGIFYVTLIFVFFPAIGLPVSFAAAYFADRA